MRVHPLCVVYNESTVVTDLEVETYLTELKYCSDHHFEPAWNMTGAFQMLPKGIGKPTGAWEAHILDTSDQAGALGYHFYDDFGLPVLRIFAKTDLQYGLSWEVTFSHEWWEALADPTCLFASQSPYSDQFYALETGDPCEGDQFAYTRNGRKISDFVTPRWFADPASSKGKFDYAGHCDKAFQVLPDGYCSIYENGSWQSFQQRGGQLVPTTDADDVDRPDIRDRNRRNDLRTQHDSDER